MGSGNVFSDLRLPDAYEHHLRVQLGLRWDARRGAL